MFENLFAVGGLSLDRLKSFVEVAEQGAIARVADGDPSRQSLISRQIGELEAFFGAELTRRKGKGLELTEAGRELARQVRLQFHGLTDFKADCARQPVEFRMAAGNSILEWLLAPAMARIVLSAEGSTFVLSGQRTGDVVRGLLDHTLDFGIVRKSAIVPPLKFRPIGKLRYALFVPKSLSALADRDLSKVPLALSVGGNFLETFQIAAKQAKQELNIVSRCTSFTLAAQLLRSGVAAAVLPSIAAPFLPSVAKPRPLSILASISRDLGIAWHRRLMDIRPRSTDLLEALANGLSVDLQKA